VDEVLRHKEEGFLAIRAQSGVPGLDKVYGVGATPRFYEPADADLPSEHDWNTQKYLARTPGLFEAVRLAVGPDIHLLHDVHHRLTPIEAARLGRSLEPFNLFWIEDPTPAENQDAFRLIRQHTTTPLAVGEVFNSVWDCKELIQNQLIDYIRCTVVHAGGITHLRRIADLADTWVPNFGIQEYMPHSDHTNDVFPHDYHFEAGFLHCGETPGHGVDIDEALAAKFPYKRAYLPVNRQKHDGTLHSW
jgi:mannonate dehydratase